MTDVKVDLERRFGGIIRLYGEKKFRLIQSCHVCVVGIGGVGSWVVESLVRHGVEGTPVEFETLHLIYAISFTVLSLLLGSAIFKRCEARVVKYL